MPSLLGQSRLKVWNGDPALGECQSAHGMALLLQAWLHMAGVMVPASLRRLQMLLPLSSPASTSHLGARVLHASELCHAETSVQKAVGLSSSVMQKGITLPSLYAASTVRLLYHTMIFLLKHARECSLSA